MLCGSGTSGLAGGSGGGGIVSSSFFSFVIVVSSGSMVDAASPCAGNGVVSSCTTVFDTAAAGSAGSAGASIGPSHPSCKPLTYSFHAFLPTTISPFSPSHSLTPILSLNGTSTDVAVSSNATSTLSPARFLYRRILSANAALTSPSRRPSTTSQSIAAATKTGLTYSTKCSRLELRLSAGGAVRKIVILRGRTLVGRGSEAM